MERIYVFKEYHDQKVGKKLMDVCIDLAKEENHIWLWLGVNIDNDRAIKFYKNYGFTIFGEKAFQLGDAVDNDYLMKLKLS
ncbi:MAG: GNAT family N-acetyltransferase [Bacteroidetes bacterium]|nr:GNAT family N-acetyltransferase [Bacteroidota bacterium]